MGASPPQTDQFQGTVCPLPLSSCWQSPQHVYIFLPTPLTSNQGTPTSCGAAVIVLAWFDFNHPEGRLGMSSVFHVSGNLGAVFRFPFPLILFSCFCSLSVLFPFCHFSPNSSFPRLILFPPPTQFSYFSSRLSSAFLYGSC